MTDPKFTQLEKRIISMIQGDMPITARPYQAIADRLGVTEEAVIETLRELSGRGVIRRFGATLRHQKSGFRANAMVAWRVEESRIDAVGPKMAAFRAVSHCYRRNPTGDWPYNLYTMIHAADEDACREIARKISSETGETDYSLLFSRNELKKISMQYFPDLLPSPSDG
ncbi:Lrp/AsnC family transcriptional regulator [Desulfococcus sp.]|uniref:siroheme decarboxylase subunit beta n=1 Tax=Desulfococcus sp. TaxID=2025834 RepID=UPI003594365E